jgi:hypothetical protein
VIAIFIAGCSGGPIATNPIVRPTASASPSTATGSTVIPVNGGRLALPESGSMPAGLTFAAGAQPNTVLTVTTTTFGQTSLTSQMRRSGQDIVLGCPLLSVNTFTVSKDIPFSLLTAYDITPLPLYAQFFGTGTFKAFLFLATDLGPAGTITQGFCAAMAASLAPGKPNYVNGYIGTGTFGSGSNPTLTFANGVDSGILFADNAYELVVVYSPATGTGSPVPSPSPSASPSPAPSASPSPSATATPTAVPSASGTLSIVAGAGNVFLGNPPAALGSFSPSLFYNGTIAGIASPMSAPYLEVLGGSPHACAVNGTIVYSLEVTYPVAFGLATVGFGYMSTIITPGTADGTAYHAELFRAGGCAQLQGPDNIAVTGGTLTFNGAVTQTVSANETDVVEFWH